MRGLGFFKTAIIVFTLLGAVPLTVFMALQQQTIKQRAASLPNSLLAQEGQDCGSGLGCASGLVCEGIRFDNDAQEEVSYCIKAIPTPTPTSTLPISISSSSAEPQVPGPSVSAPTSTSVKTRAVGEFCFTDSQCQTFFCKLDADGDSGVCTQPAIPTAVSTKPSATPILTVILSQTPSIAVVSPTDIPTTVPSVTITIQYSTPIALPYCYLKEKGDSNCDNKVNILDYEIWRTEFLEILKGIQLITKPSDFNKDGKTDIVDINIWRTSFGDSSLPH